VSKKILLDYDADTKTQEVMHLDGTGQAVIESIQDVESSIEFNRLMADKHDPKEERWFVSNIPNSLCLKWSQECGAKPFTKEWTEYAKKMVMDRDFSKLNPNRIKM
jgi:hypothetical protein